MKAEIAAFFPKAVKLIGRFFDALYGVIRKLNLQLLFTVGAVWVVCLAFAGDAARGQAFKTAFIVLAAVAGAYALIVTAFNAAAYIRTLPERKKAAATTVSAGEIAAEVSGRQQAKYYRVAQNPNYVMADYPDRYELYYNDNGNLKFVRMTLKKPQGENKEEGNG